MQVKHPRRETLQEQARPKVSPRAHLDARHGKPSKELLRIRRQSFRRTTSPALVLKGHQAWARRRNSQAPHCLSATPRIIRSLRGFSSPSSSHAVSKVRCAQLVRKQRLSSKMSRWERWPSDRPKPPFLTDNPNNR